MSDPHLLAEEILELEATVNEWTDHDCGPYYHDDGRLAEWGRGKSGPAPAHHPRRCRGMCKNGWHAGHRCGRWAETGRNFCYLHGGRRSMMGTRYEMPRRYKKLMPRLAEKLTAFLEGETHAQQLELYEEIALARTFLDELLEMNTVVSEQPDTPIELKMALMKQIQDATTHVSDLVSKMARVERDLDDKVSVRALGMFVQDITRAIYKRLGETPEAQLLIEDLSTRIQVPEDASVDPQIIIEVEE